MSRFTLWKIRTLLWKIMSGLPYGRLCLGLPYGRLELYYGKLCLVYLMEDYV